MMQKLEATIAYPVQQAVFRTRKSHKRTRCNRVLIWLQAQDCEGEQCVLHDQWE